MAIIRMKCTTCKREIEIPENKKGLEVINRCVITSGCRGEMYRIDRKIDYIRGEFPSRVPGLTEYTPRRALYNHIQSIPSNQWFITHNLGVAPSVQVEISNTSVESTQENVPCALRDEAALTTTTETTDFTIEITSPNTLIITFPENRTGLAQMIARSTSPVVISTVEAEVPTFQLTSTQSHLTIATLNDTIPSGNTITLNFVFLPPGSSSTVSQSYTIDSTPDPVSPWYDLPVPQTVFIQGRRYKVRSFNVFILSFENGTIPDGSAFYIESINDGAGSSPESRPLETGEVVALLALDPYAGVDKITTRLLDFSRVTASNAESSLFHEDGEFFAFDNVLTSTFPPIIEVS